MGRVTTQGQTTDREFLNRLDAAIGCQTCGHDLGDSPSDIYCSEECSEEWSDRHTYGMPDWSYPEESWQPADLEDLQPVSWLPSRVWRLRRATGDLDADWAALKDATRAAATEAQRQACATRRDALEDRQRVIWAREWRLPRETRTLHHDQIDLEFAVRSATTDAQRAACRVRRESLNSRREAAQRRVSAGRLTSWVFDSPLRDFPIVTAEQAQRYADRILAGRSTDSDCDFNASFGTRMENRLPGIRPSTIQVRMVSAPQMLRYELRRDSDGTLMALCTVPDGQQISIDLPYYADTSGCSWRIRNSRGEVIRQFPVTSPRLWATPEPAPIGTWWKPPAPAAR